MGGTIINGGGILRAEGPISAKEMDKRTQQSRKEHDMLVAKAPKDITYAEDNSAQMESCQFHFMNQTVLHEKHLKIDLRDSKARIPT